MPFKEIVPCYRVSTWNILFWLNPLPDDKILEWSKVKQTADDNLECI